MNFRKSNLARKVRLPRVFLSHMGDLYHEFGAHKIMLLQVGFQGLRKDIYKKLCGNYIYSSRNPIILGKCTILKDNSRFLKRNKPPNLPFLQAVLTVTILAGCVVNSLSSSGISREQSRPHSWTNYLL